ncbi:MAG: polysaccharide deacetylase family protein [Solirubrobacterales bacterium]|nr:polysaccharide deacetylase family protein [Solirubrobacterales bacterium]
MSTTDPGAHARPHAIVLSFDNLGEASELERGTWDHQVALGHHASVTMALPRLLDELDALGLSATFFVEALNCELYPQALLEIAGRGHELGVHGWRHEAWGQLSPEREGDLLARAARAFRALGLPTRAFRPPGGESTVRTQPLLRELGFQWWSPARGSGGGGDRPATIPFDWELVDAYHLMNRFDYVRVRLGDSRAPLQPAVAAERLCAVLATGSGTQVLILHPFLMLDSRWWEGVRGVLALVAQLTAERRAWVGPGGELAQATR